MYAAYLAPAPASAPTPPLAGPRATPPPFAPSAGVSPVPHRGEELPPPPMGDYSVFAGNVPKPTAFKTVRLFSTATSEMQTFRVCEGERGEAVRCAVRGAFGLPDGEPFTVRDTAGCNVVLGFQSVADGAQYELVIVPARRQGSAEPAAASPAPGLGRRSLSIATSARPQGIDGVPVGQDLRLREHQMLLEDYVDRPRGYRRFPMNSTISPAVVRNAHEVGPLHGKFSARSPVPNVAKSLLIGISYSGQREEVSGCVDDARSMQRMLRDLGFAAEERVLTDNAADPAARPTRANIEAALEWLVGGVRAGQTCFLHYSGHAVELRTGDPGASHGPGTDQALLPVDFRASRPFQFIVDSDIQKTLLQLAPGARLIFVCDCCHTGTLMDLPFGIRCLKGAAGVESAGRLECFERSGHPEFANDVLMLSTQRDEFTSADVLARGALTQAFIQSLHTDSHPTMEQLLMDIRNSMVRLLGRGSPVPVLSCSRRVDHDERFHLGPAS
eukprot:Hpha_TRINITY_DN16859_c2_g14::TRINITY_DN16859_c2_g14_i1::g.152629::m.152629